MPSLAALAVAIAIAVAVSGCGTASSDTEAKDDERNIAWVREYYEATAPLSEEGGYINFMAEDDQGRIRANYKGNYDRLAEIKRTYDPANLFRRNQKILPK